MTTRSWIRKLFARHPRERTIRRAAQRARLRLEALEDRYVPSTFTVNNLLDDGSVGSLRWAVGQANSNPGNNTINLSGTQLELTDTTGTETIAGPAAGVTVSGNNASREFQVDNLVTASIS